MKKLVFLDFDGVLNSMEWLSLDQDNWIRFDPTLVGRLNRILEATGAEVVISSSWRVLDSMESIQRTLDDAGFKGKVIDKTPARVEHPAACKCGDEWARGHEIQAWLDGERFEGAFVILDDNSDMAHLRNRLVHTHTAEGLQDSHVDQAIEMLNGRGV